MEEQEWLEEIQTIDSRAKFVRLADDMINYHQPNDGRLTVLMVYSRGDNRGKYYYCQCDCGKRVVVWGAHFRNGHTKSCGCWHDESSKIQMTKLNQTGRRYSGHNLSGQIVNGYKVLKKIGQNNNLEWVYQCLCPRCNQECYKTERGIRDTISCGCVKSRGETKIVSLLTNAKIKFVREKIFKDCVTSDLNELRFDFFVEDKYLIEYDGIQHYQEIPFFKTDLKITKERDMIKNKWCKEHNIPLIRIPYTHLDNLCIDDLLLETSDFIVEGTYV